MEDKKGLPIDLGKIYMIWMEMDEEEFKQMLVKNNITAKQRKISTGYDW